MARGAGKTDIWLKPFLTGVFPMSSATDVPARQSDRTPFVYRIPVLGAIAREWAEGDKDFPLMLVFALVSLWAVAVVFFGLPALYLTAVALVPLMGVLLVLITLG
jgi:hypothetical protein